MRIEKPTHWRFKDLEGKRFDRLLVESYAGKRGRVGRWNTLCDCGNRQVVQTGNLVTKNTRSCGCLCRELTSKSKRKHGESKGCLSNRTAEYSTWISMRQRCSDANSPSYERYGGRGISVCERWLSYDSFLEDMGRKPSPEYSIERIDNSGNYEPSNCKWATVKEQVRNRRSNRMLTFNGITKCLIEWSEETGINRGALEARLKRGWSIEKSLTTPVRHMKSSKGKA
jgi:hypothetical protein